MNTANHDDPRARILNASIELFSQKGYDATRVSEIAESAEVNKSLIYYYFKSKEEILDTLLDALMNQLTALSMDFIDNFVVPMIKDGRLDIDGDRFEFVDSAAAEYFKDHLTTHYERLVDYLLKERSVVRILMFESLRHGRKHDSSLFRFFELLDKNPSNPAYSTIRSADEDFEYSDDTVFFKFFFSLIPLVSIAAYYDEYKAKSLLSDERMKELTLRSLEMLVKGVQDRYMYVFTAMES
ncbi:MAG: TetR/AcrR family transcriptional regulator [Limnochordia bacterium]|jgi:AcrR family transcriptional regulator